MSTMTAIMGRMATYSGKLIEWDEAINSKLQLMPEKVSWDMEPPVKPDADGNLSRRHARRHDRPLSPPVRHRHRPP